MVVYNDAYIGGTSLTATTGITAGSTYNFQIAATTNYGSSTFTSVFSIIAATIPDPPTDLTRDEVVTD